ncbi:MAG: Type 1 glutamine amidotransferase-like domain-containing protein [Alphaproteobacteria bacterium]|nr:Type 1 glutamine amidotransferase-like domain-containing protein [Alphaproteobacteria bacterium]
MVEVQRIEMYNNQLVLFSCGQLSVMKKIWPRLKKPEPSLLKAVCIPTAGLVYPEKERDWHKDEIGIFQKFGFKLDFFDLEEKSQEETYAKLSDADVIYVTGGNTFHLLACVQRTGFEKIVRERLAQGALYIGVSAGSIIACPHIEYIEPLEDTPVSKKNPLNGLELVDFYIVPHVGSATHSQNAEKCIQTIKGQLGKRVVELKDSQAIFVDGNYIEIVE